MIGGWLRRLFGARSRRTDAGSGYGARPVALVYRGPASLPGCAEAVAAVLRRGPWRFDVRFVGPREDRPLCAGTLAGAALYAQPGGGALSKGYRHLRREKEAVRSFVAGGGHYLGFCLGGYLAGATPGFGLLPGDTDQYIASTRATVDHTRDTVVDVEWRGRSRTLFFQDGPHFLVDDDAAGQVTVLARYPNGTVAALVAPFGRGAVGVVGPHPEATAEWYTDAGMRAPRGTATDLAQDLVDTLLAVHR